LKVKDDEEKAGDTLLERRFVRDDLDVSVKASPSAADKPNSSIRRQNVFYLLKTGWMARFSRPASLMDTEMLHEQRGKGERP
jgi:hypothetical protein